MAQVFPGPERDFVGGGCSVGPLPAALDGRSVVTARLCLIISLEEIVWDVAVIRFRAWRPYPGASSRPLAGQSKWLYHRGEDPGYKSATIQARAPRPRLATFCLTIIYEFYQT